MPFRPATAACEVQRLGLVEYQQAWALQRRLVEACREDGAPRLLLLEHPPTYTLGVRGRAEHLLLAERALAELGAAVHRTDRGGDITFHGPGQLVGYPVVDLRRWREGPVWYVRSLQDALIQALAAFGIEGHCEPGRPGVWTGDAKIASIGVRVSRGITSHGFALNVDPDLRYFSHIIPCGLPDVRVTSMAEVLRNTNEADISRKAGACRDRASAPSGPKDDRRDRPSGLSGPHKRRNDNDRLRSMNDIGGAVARPAAPSGPHANATPTNVPPMNDLMDSVVAALGETFGLTMEERRTGVQPSVPMAAVV